MTDRIETFVEKAIRYTQEILVTHTASWRVARVGLLKMATNIEDISPTHPALVTLHRFIVELDAAHDRNALPN